MFKIWGLARPYRFRLWLGVLTGMIAGVFEPLFIVTVVFVFGIIFPLLRSGTLNDNLPKSPALFEDWLTKIHDSLQNGVQAHPGAIVLLLALIPIAFFCAGCFPTLNVYLLQWVGDPRRSPICASGCSRT